MEEKQQNIKLDTVALAFEQTPEQGLELATKQGQDNDRTGTVSRQEQDNSGTGLEHDWDRTEYVTVQEASRILGKRTGVLRKSIKRGTVKGERKEGRWVIPRSELDKLAKGQDWDRTEAETGQDRDSIGTGLGQYRDRTGTGMENTVILPIDTWQEYQKERDTLRDGLMMYRFQFEELARRLKALPVPPELVAEKLRKQEEELKKKTELEAKLQEEQKARADLEAKANKLVEELEAEKKRSWWKKLFGIK